MSGRVWGRNRKGKKGEGLYIFGGPRIMKSGDKVYVDCDFVFVGEVRKQNSSSR